jgi:8-oxo-dGTP diphosphatase
MPITARELETDRLILRPLRAADAPELARLADDWLVARYTANIPHPYTQSMADEFIGAQTYEPGARDSVFAIVLKSTGLPIGCIGLHEMEAPGRAEVGFWIGRAHWGQGIATEALRRIADFAFSDCRIAVLEAGAVPTNEGSHRVQAKVGFAPVGVREDVAPARGHPIQIIVRELTKEHWLAGAGPALATLVVVAVALLDADGRVLLARRPAGKSMAGLWEFPGGKLARHESPEAALIRELKEELDIDVKKSCLAPLTFASHAYDDFHLLMPVYVCRRWEGQPHPREGQEIAWVRPGALKNYPMPPADAPLIPVLLDLL